MARRLDQILVIDVESTCWEGPPPRGQISEIIEIGLCMLDAVTLERIEKREILVRPQQSEVSDFCTKLTTLTAEQVSKGIPLHEAIDILARKYVAQDRLFASWGDYDRGQFQRNCDHYKIKYPFGPTHLNIKNLFSITLGISKEMGIDGAMKRVGLEMEGTHHRGVDDAWNIAALLAWLLRRGRAEKLPEVQPS